MNPVNATALYVSACRAMLQCDSQAPESYGELFNVLPFFRDSLSCLVCGNLLRDPVSPHTSACQHFVCRGCKGKMVKLKPQCSCGRNQQQFDENKQLQVLVECYRSLCEYIAAAEKSAARVPGYEEVMRMVEDVLGVRDEHMESGVLEEPRMNLPQQTYNTTDSQPKTVANCLSQADSGGVSSGEQRKCMPSSKNIKSELDSCSPVAVPGNGGLTAPQQTSTNISDSGGRQTASTIPVLLSKMEVLGSLESDCAKAEPQVSACVSCSEAELCQQVCQSATSGAVSPDHPQQPQTGITCLAPAHRKVRLCRKRSRSESDSEMLQPLPLACFMQKPRVAATVPPQAASVPRVHCVPMSVPRGEALDANRTLLDSTKNVQKNNDFGPKKVPSKAKVVTAKAKAKDRDRVLSGNPTKVVYKKSQEKKGCKCGRATQNPSVLTCRGQRCPCYSNRKACLDCICRGCQNSYMANGEKKLEAFAVPEKALEQTRLTLGINLTSISVMSAGSGAGVLGLSAASPMASFLSGSPEKEATFKDPIEMHF
ncbi:E3 ubiquitin-protein ligase MSL2a [Brachyhypopomus gauderio]|uniref:E3 ubiquitin-protein ligase MSL2a n=1 Tax=Brachyhypopomus gauderio TaxID=698409 RepID=UPI004042325B